MGGGRGFVGGGEGGGFDFYGSRSPHITCAVFLGPLGPFPFSFFFLPRWWVLLLGCALAGWGKGVFCVVSWVWRGGVFLVLGEWVGGGFGEGKVFFIFDTVRRVGGARELGVAHGNRVGGVAAREPCRDLACTRTRRRRCDSDDVGRVRAADNEARERACGDERSSSSFNMRETSAVEWRSLHVCRRKRSTIFSRGIAKRVGARCWRRGCDPRLPPDLPRS